MSKRKNVGKEKILSYAVSLSIFYTEINMFVQVISKLIGIPTNFTNELIIGTTVGLLAISIIISKNKVILNYLGIPFILLFLYLLSYLMFMENREYLQSMILLNLIISILTYIVVRIISDDKVLIDTITKVGRLIIIMMSIIIYFKATGRYEFQDANYMGISYALLLPVIILIGLEKRTKVDSLLLSMGIFLLVTSGGRGSLVSLVLYYFVLKFKEIKKSPIKLLVLSSVSFITMLSYDKLINWFIQFSLERNFGGNIVNYILIGNIFSDSSRIELLKASLHIINDNFIFGTGLGGDRATLPIYSNVGGVYTHNFFTEIIVQYGIVLGSFFLVVLTILSVNAFLSDEGVKKTIFLSLFFSTGFMQLMFSSSYLLTPEFFVLLAILFKIRGKM